MSDGREHEVLVIGAGPTGLMAALELRRLGVPTTVIDGLPEPHRQSRATAVLPWSLELLEPSGATAAIVDQSVHTSGADVRAPDGTLVGGYHLDAVPSRYPWFAALPQWRTEAILHDRLVAHGGDVIRGVRATAITERDDGVDVTLERADASVEHHTARWVVGATGPDPTVRHALHEALRGGDYPRRYLVADVRVEADLDPHRSAMFTGPMGLAVLLPLPEGRRVVVLDGGDPVGSPVPDLAEVRDHLGERVSMALRVSDLTWSSCFTLHHRVAPRFASDRVFLTGDAAHLSSLFGAFGMNGGFQDAVNLAWKVALVHTGRAHAALLDTYHPERRAEATVRVAMADAMHVGIVEPVGGGPAGAEPDSSTSPLPSDPDAANLARCMLDVRYPAGPGIGPGGGGRFPAADRVTRDGSFGLFLGSDIEPPSRLLHRWRATIGSVDVGTIDRGAALVRPDGIVGWSTDAVQGPADATWATLDRHLAALHIPA